jgi:hypothetical protein
MNNRSRRLLRLSRFTHRWLGLTGLLYFFGMAVSGVLLNHPALISSVDLPRKWIPGDYSFRQWNRNSLRGAVRGPQGETYLYGEAGVWRLEAGIRVPVALNTGLSSSVYYRDTRTLLRVNTPRPYLLAGTRGGLFLLRLGEETAWQRVPLGSHRERETVVDLIRVENRVLAVTRSRVYTARLGDSLQFADTTPTRVPEPTRRIPLFRLVFHLHSGDVWGLPGRLAVDLLGLAVAFLTVTGAYFWWRKRRRTLARGSGGRWARRGLVWHNRLGLWLAPLVALLAVTGLFQRPPFLIAIVNASYPPRYHPAPVDPNPWYDLLRKALYDSERKSLVLATADGFFEGPSDLSRPFRRIVGDPPVSVMGATVFRSDPRGRYWIGSMSGLYVWDRATGRVTDAFTGRPPRPSQRGPVGEHQVVGFVADPNGGFVAADYGRGLLDSSGRPRSLPLPPSLVGGGRISLWHALFEFHNGRIFGFLLGWWTWLVVPLGSLGLLTEVGTGVFDRWFPRIGRGRSGRGADRNRHDGDKSQAGM